MPDTPVPTDRIPDGVARVDDRTVDDEAPAPFESAGAPTPGRGTTADVEAFTESRWLTSRGGVAPGTW